MIIVRARRLKNFQTICKVNEESRKIFPIFELSNIKEMKLPKFY